MSPEQLADILNTYDETDWMSIFDAQDVSEAIDWIATHHENQRSPMVSVIVLADGAGEIRLDAVCGEWTAARSRSRPTAVS